MALTTEQQALVEQRLANDKKSTLVAYLLWFFLGGLGAHRFYLGKTGSAVGMLVLFVLGLILSTIVIGLALLLIYVIWWLIDAFLIPGMITQDTRLRRTEIANELNATSGE